MAVVVETTLGDITVDLFVKERPQTCLNFLKLCKMKYYNLNLFHSVNANFCAQTGDPTGKGDGGESIHGLLRGEGYRFYQAESVPKIKHDETGLISMVSHGKGMLGSQFIITLCSDLGSLDGEHCVFGRVVEGSDVLLKLNEAITDEQHRPYQDIRITHTVVLEDPFPDPEGLPEPPSSPLHPSSKDVAYSRIPADENLSESYSQEELNEMVQAREAAARATILEMVGDLPDADVAPPENVLFVCKLNPVTSDHDLSLIFSRFGKVKGCEVIRDSVTGESLQYAFVEFEDKKSCEEAYFKMDNVLIDERRIHVDFSQSVAKWRGKGRGVEMLGPPPPGGWGNKSKSYRNNRQPAQDLKPSQKDSQHKQKQQIKREASHSPDSARIKNGKSSEIRKKVVVKKEVSKKRRRPSPTSSSSSSQTSSSSSSSDSSDTEPVKKKSRCRKTEKVLVVVRTPRSKRHKKSKKRRSKKMYGNDTDDDTHRKKRKPRKRVSKSSSSSDEQISIKKKGRKDSTPDEKEKRKRKKRRKPPPSDSSSDTITSEDEVVRKLSKKGAKRRKQSDDSSETETRKKKKKSKKGRGSAKKRQQTNSSSESESSD